VSTPLAPFPDAELVALDLLEPLAGQGLTVTHTDEDLAAPTIQVQRTGGPDDGITDRPVLQVTTYGATRQQAWDLFRSAQQIILAAGGSAVTGDYVTNVLIDYTGTVSAGRQLPYENPDLRTVVGEFRLDFRRPNS
jgi:hypothetical protein